MARKKTSSSASSGGASKKKRKRRSPDQIIADLQEEIRRVRSRQVARELKQSPAFKAALAAIKSLDKALDAAAEEGQSALRHALAGGRKELGSFLEEQGLRLPKPNLPKGPRPGGSK
jgi:hypothetical protein